MILDAIGKVVEMVDLTREEASTVMEEIMSGKTSNAQIASFLTALRMKNITVEELVGFVRVMREKAEKVPVEGVVEEISGTSREMLIDTCGTGGDASGTFNISTATTFVVAGAGIKVAKHGNRSVSSLCGSADVIESLGINLELTPEQVSQCINETGIGFLFAPLLHKAMKHVMSARKDIRIRTVFNILGPLTNPAGANAQLLGVYDGELTEKMAYVLKEFGSKRAFIVHSMDGLDEITNTAETKVTELKGNRITTYHIKPEDFGIRRASMKDIQGGNAKVNAGIIINILRGEKGPRRDIVLLNAGAGIMVGGSAETMEEGIQKARESIDSGEALKRLESLKKITNEFKTV
jgi:anthranilate phosphoribosyltransferase